MPGIILKAPVEVIMFSFPEDQYIKTFYTVLCKNLVQDDACGNEKAFAWTETQMESSPDSPLRMLVAMGAPGDSISEYGNTQ